MGFWGETYVYEIHVTFFSMTSTDLRSYYVGRQTVKSFNVFDHFTIVRSRFKGHTAFWQYIFPLSLAVNFRIYIFYLIKQMYQYFLRCFVVMFYRIFQEEV